MFLRFRMPIDCYFKEVGKMGISEDLTVNQVDCGISARQQEERGFSLAPDAKASLGQAGGSLVKVLRI